MLLLPASASAMTAHPHLLQQYDGRVSDQSLPTCASRLYGECNDGIIQYLHHLLRMSELPPVSPADAFRAANKCPSLVFWAFSHCFFFSSSGLGVSETICKPSKRGISVFHSTLGPPDINPVGFPSQTLSHCGAPTLCFSRSACLVRYPSLLCVLALGVEIFMRSHLCLS